MKYPFIRVLRIIVFVARRKIKIPIEIPTQRFSPSEIFDRLSAHKSVARGLLIDILLFFNTTCRSGRIRRTMISADNNMNVVNW